MWHIKTYIYIKVFPNQTTLRGAIIGQTMQAIFLIFVQPKATGSQQLLCLDHYNSINVSKSSSHNSRNNKNARKSNKICWWQVTQEVESRGRNECRLKFYDGSNAIWKFWFVLWMVPWSCRHNSTQLFSHAGARPQTSFFSLSSWTPSLSFVAGYEEGLRFSVLKIFLFTPGKHTHTFWSRIYPIVRMIIVWIFFFIFK